MYRGMQGRSARSGTSYLGLEAWGLIVGILREAQTPEIFQSNHRDLITSLLLEPGESRLELSCEPEDGDVRQKREARKEEFSVLCFCQAPVTLSHGMDGTGIITPIMQ